MLFFVEIHIFLDRSAAHHKALCSVDDQIGTVRSDDWRLCHHCRISFGRLHKFWCECESFIVGIGNGSAFSSWHLEVILSRNWDQSNTSQRYRRWPWVCKTTNQWTKMHNSLINSAKHILDQNRSRRLEWNEMQLEYLFCHQLNVC